MSLKSFKCKFNGYM